MADESTVLTGAFGSVLGYLGGEAAKVYVFERLLWPQRFYNDWTFTIAVRQCLFLTMGGPLHNAALETLETFRKHKLYQGRARGHMLGTAFYTDSKVPYTVIEPAPRNEQNDDSNNEHTDTPGDPGSSRDAPRKKETVMRPSGVKETRNAFWVEVSRRVPQDNIATAADVESPEQGTRRTLVSVNLLKLSVDTTVTGDSEIEAETEPAPEKPVAVSEAGITWPVVLGILTTETVSIIVAIILATRSAWGMFAYMLIPLVLKYGALLASVNRTGLIPKEKLFEEQGNEAAQREAQQEAPKEAHEAPRLFKVSDPEQDYLIIQGPCPVVKQFFQHYGHPIRDRVTADRRREVVCIAIVYAFVLYFPVGLVTIVFMDTDVQYVWLGYQLYAILSMHIIRFMGWEGCGRTEERVAKLLNKHLQVTLESPKGAAIRATLIKYTEPNERNAQNIINAILKSKPIK